MNTFLGYVWQMGCLTSEIRISARDSSKSTPYVFIEFLNALIMTKNYQKVGPFCPYDAYMQDFRKYALISTFCMYARILLLDVILEFPYIRLKRSIVRAYTLGWPDVQMWNPGRLS